VPASLLPSLEDESLGARIHGQRPEADYARARKAYADYHRLRAETRAASDELDLAIYEQWSAGIETFQLARALRISPDQVRHRAYSGAEIAARHLTDDE
jgi:hypothetical protein